MPAKGTQSMNATSAHDTTALVVIGGLPPKRSIVQHLPRYDFVIAADSGLHAAIDLGLRVAAVVGDMDSVDPAVLAVAEVTGSHIERVSHDKDNTDTELALLTAVARGARRITLITGGGGRLDHQLGVLAVMQHPALAECSMEAFWDTARLHLVRGPGSITIMGAVGSIVGISPAGGSAEGINANGLRWTLSNESLLAHSTRGISNEMTEPQATISVAKGNLFVIQPNALEG
jgi:thiamine pyrophosphokinase